jgi:hypothetical protein
MSKYRDGEQPDDLYIIPAQSEEPESDVPEGLIVVGIVFFGTMVVCALTILTAKMAGFF